MSAAPGRIDALAAHFVARADTLLSDLESLVTRESPSEDAEKVSALTAWIAGRLARTGLVPEAVPCEGRGDAFRLRLGTGEGGTLLLGHLDTVWPAGTLGEIPFRVEDGNARGPGVFDMKGGIAVALSVLDAIAEGAVLPAAPVTLLLTPDEEIGSHASRDLLVAEARRRQRVLVLEPAGDGGAAKVARKGTGLVVARFHGVASHAGLDPEKGASALAEMARYVLHAEALADLAAGTSVVPTVASAGTKTNVVPERAEVTVDYRVWNGAEGDRVTTALTSYRCADPRVTVEVEGGVNRPPMEPSGTSLAIHRRAAAIAERLGFALPGTRVGGGSDGNLTSAAGVPTLDGLGPAGAGAHARHERLEVADLPRRAALLAALLEEVPS